MKRSLRHLPLIVAALLVVLSAVMLRTGVWKFNHPSETIRGVDVSHHQGDIDWPVLAESGDLEFAYVKATEGSGSVDERFPENWSGARSAGLRVGAYHFFSFESPGATQAENFIAAVPAEPDALPPAIDVERYGGRRLPPADAVLPELRDMVAALAEHYDKPPVFYCTMESYRAYIAGNFDDCGVWIRSVYWPPFAPDDWLFWQYSDRGRLPGTSGREKYVDLNVFHGTQAEFDALAQ